MANEELTFSPRGRNTGRLSLWLGLAAAAGAAVLIALILSGGTDKEKVVPATRLAVVANRDVPAQERITPEMLKVETFELSEVEANAFTAADQLESRVTATRIRAGQVIVPSMVSTTTCENLSCRIPPDKVAEAIGVTEVVIGGGNITPDDRVDVIGVFKVPPNTDVRFLIESLTGESAPFIPQIPPNRASTVSFTLMYNIRVAAVAQNLPNQPEPAPTSTAGSTTNPAPSEAPNPKAATVTLEVTPHQAEILPIAEETGTLRLSLRPFGEQVPAPRPPPIITLLD
jgi:Flp pilus assembly protein CpaB